jgi:hypothetical protein
LLVTGWYGRAEQTVEIVSGIALWNNPGQRVPIRYGLVRDPTGGLEPQAFLCTDLDADPLVILRWFVRRWSIEVTFAEVRRLGLFSVITLWAHQQYTTHTPTVRIASWYRRRGRPSATRLPTCGASYGQRAIYAGCGKWWTP